MKSRNVLLPTFTCINQILIKVRCILACNIVVRIVWQLGLYSRPWLTHITADRLFLRGCQIDACGDAELMHAGMVCSQKGKGRERERKEVDPPLSDTLDR